MSKPWPRSTRLPHRQAGRDGEVWAVGPEPWLGLALGAHAEPRPRMQHRTLKDGVRHACRSRTATSGVAADY
eukprot:364781-Chlamydomonas_euryale.AAC.13